jgi:maleamate amidohydrolase
MENPALIVIDLLNDFLDSWPAADRAALLNAVNELVGLARERRWPVLWVRQEFEPDLEDAFLEMRDKGIRRTIRNTPGSEFVPELKVLPTERQIVKKRYSAFFGTSLDEMLARTGADTLVIAGINTHACIRMTVVDAYQRDWRVVVALDCVGSYDREHHDITLRYLQDKICRLMTNVEIRLRILRN